MGEQESEHDRLSRLAKARAAQPAERERRSQQMRNNWANGRMPHGDNHPTRKLTDAQVVEIRQLYATHQHFLADIAARFGVKKSTITALVHNRYRV